MHSGSMLPGPVPSASLAAFLRTHSAAVLGEWEAQVRRRQEVARRKPEPVLLDHMPDMVARIADCAERCTASTGEGLEQMLAPLADQHAVQRLDRGFDLGEVVHEYTLLRSCILRALGEQGVLPTGDAQFVAAAVDFLVAQAVGTFTQVQRRTLEAMDRISVAAIESDDVGMLLERLLETLLDLVPAVDAADIRLQETGGLVVRAALASGGAPADGPLTERLARQVASEGVPRSLEAPTGEVRALRAVPLRDASTVIGVACMASSSTGAFSDGDLRLFDAFCNRATLLIRQHTLYERMQAARSEAEAAVGVREDLLAIVSHDLRNPLGTIRMSTALLARKLPPADPRLRQLVELIDRASSRMELLIADLLDMTRLKTGRFELELAQVPVANLLQDAFELHLPLAQERGLGLSSTPAPGEPVVCCDAKRVQQVFTNLVGNAIKFTPAGGSIAISASVHDDHVEFAVRDTGPGIAAEDLPNLFQAYWSARKDARRGTGLGLFISKGIVRSHGGTITVDSRPGEGTVVRFSLPLPGEGGCVQAEPS